MLKGSCLCGAVAYEADAEIDGVAHCHCETCRKAHGAAFSSIASVPKASFRWVRGQERLGSYESSPGKVRRFCTTCGSQLIADRTDREVLMLRLGCLDTPAPGSDGQWHIWLSDKASWYDPSAPIRTRPEGF